MPSPMTPTPMAPAGQSEGETRRNDPDPFADIPAADPAAVEVRQRAFQRPEKACDLIGKPKRKKVDFNPLQRRWFEKNGYTYHRVESHDAWAGRTKDLYGCFDYIAARADQPGTLYVQVARKSDLARRRRKVMTAEATPVLLASGNRVQLHCWYQENGKGSRWEMRIEEITSNELR